MISHILEAGKAVEASRTIVVLGFGLELVKAELPRGVEWVEQKRQLGTGHAIRQTKDSLMGFKGEILVLCGDTPLLRGDTLKNLVARHRQEKAAATVLTAILHDPTGYGRIIRKENDRLARIVEEKETTIYEKAIEEVNSGTYCFDSSILFECLEKIRPDNQSKEYYLTDVVELLNRRKEKVMAVLASDGEEILGINSREQLAMANKAVYRQIARRHMENGVTIVDPETTFIDKKARIGQDSIIFPFTTIEGATIIGEGCQVGPAAHLIDAFLADGVRCRPAVIKNKKIKAGLDIGVYKFLEGKWHG
jgi:bifunctional UDP-N-acetylglucosamine pyrophosphorylase/glucosamine-1-phosphate N-acetyltransferase